MNSDSGEDMMVDDWLTAKQDLLDTSDEELNDDLLRSDEESETMRCHDESITRPNLQAIAKPYLVCRTSHLAKDPATCDKEEQTEVEVDPGEVLDIEINAPSGDEFQDVGDYRDHQQTNIMKDCLKVVSKSSMQESCESGAELQEGLSPHHILSSCSGQPDPEETLTGPGQCPEPRFPGQHMFDQQHPASVLDDNPLLAGQTPMGSPQPSGSESDPWRTSSILQGPVDPSKCRSLQPRRNPLQKHPSAQSGTPFTAPSGPQAKKPAVLVRAVARKGSSAKPMAVARGMPNAARQPASAKSTNSAKTPPAQGMVRRNVGQKVKEEPQTPPAPQKLPAMPLNIKNNKECGDELYRHRLKQQIQLRKEIFRQKEQRRCLRALNKKQQLLEHLQTNPKRRWKNNQHLQQHPAPHVQQTDQRSWSRKVIHQPNFHNPSCCSVLSQHPEHRPLPPQQHQCNVVVPTHRPPWQQAPAARGRSSGSAAELNHPHQWGTDRVVFPDQRNLHYSAWPSPPQQVWKGEKRILEEIDSDMPVPAKIRVVKHFNPSARQESASSDLTPQMSDMSRTVIETNSRVVTFTTPDLSPPSFLQHGPNLIYPNQRRVSTPNWSQQNL